ncbi:MAG: hypothetical protein WC815_01180 [Vicinamibacterales bacterium]
MHAPGDRFPPVFGGLHLPPWQWRAFDVLGRVTSEVILLRPFDYTYTGVTSRLATVTYARL